MDQVRARKGVLTTTISHYGEQIIEPHRRASPRLRRQEAAVHARLLAKQAELDQAIAELGAPATTWRSCART